MESLVNLFNDKLKEINSISEYHGFESKYHSCEECGKFPRYDIIEFFTNDTKVGTLVSPTNIFTWGKTQYRIEDKWDIDYIMYNNKL